MKRAFFLSPILLVLAVVFSAPSQSVPKLINYQGRLTDASGQQPLSNGVYKVMFELYDTKSAPSNLIWGASYNVSVVLGQFNVVLGAAGGSNVVGASVNDIGFAFGGSERYLQMTIQTDGTGTNNITQPVLPRQQILSTPYAMNGVPTGSVMPFAGTNIPSGWVLCDGATNTAANPLFSGLFASIGKTYGVGDGTLLSFQVPDLRGRVVVGSGQGVGLINRPLSANLGVENITQVPNHTHPINLNTDLDGSHTHVIERTSGVSLKWGDGGGSSSDRIDSGDVTAGDPADVRARASGSAHSHHISGATGYDPNGVESVDNLQPSLVLYYIIRL
jgi:microcystin-dependent protein